jgi:ATP-dependent RNA helicase DDX19/DBP5
MQPPIVIEAAIQGEHKARGARSAAQVVVGTPGKTLQWLQQRYLSAAKLKVFVIDEADAMVSDSETSRSLGGDTRLIHAMLPPSVQILFFSATYSQQVLELAKALIPRAVRLQLRNPEDVVLSEIHQFWVDAKESDDGKLGVLAEVYKKLPIQQSIVFVERKVDADRISSMMSQRGYDVSTLHSDLSGQARDAVMAEFRNQRSRVLITTNVLARGVDVQSIAVVINVSI